LGTFSGCVLVAMLGLLCGCPSPPGGMSTTPARPPRETREIIDVIQKNAALVDRALWSNSVSVTARFKDEQGKSHTYNLEGSMLFRGPRDLRIDLRPGVGDRVMGLGSNADDYWIWIEPELHLMRWGRHRFAGLACAEKVPARPDQLASVLGFSGLPMAEQRLAGPARQFGTQFDILLYMRQSDDGEWRLERRYYVDRVPPYLIRVVNFHDALGRVVMSAFLDDFRAAWEAGPVVPHKFTILWPLDDAKFYMEAAKIEGRMAVSPKAFNRPTAAELPSGVRDIIQVDADCEPALRPASMPAH
jgi:hypothetical protein